MNVNVQSDLDLRCFRYAIKSIPKNLLIVQTYFNAKFCVYSDKHLKQVKHNVGVLN